MQAPSENLCVTLKEKQWTFENIVQLLVRKSIQAGISHDILQMETVQMTSKKLLNSLLYRCLLWTF